MTARRSGPFPAVLKRRVRSTPDTAVRETLEETGLAIIARDQIGERTHPKTGRHMVYVAADPINCTAVKVGDPDEHSEVGWYPWATAEGMLPYLFEPVADHLRRALSA